MTGPMHVPTGPLHTRRGLRQRGVSLIFALITLGALALAALAMIRSVDNGTLVLGNLGFKQDTLLTSDDAVRSALDWLNSNVAAATLNGNGAVGTGYYASVDMNLDPTGTATPNTRVLVDWDNDNCAYATAGSFATCIKASNPALSLPNNVTARYIIVRLCNGAGTITDTNMHCAKPLTAGAATASRRGSFSYADTRPTPVATASPYYRIVVRTKGGRDTVTFVETLVHF